MSNFREVEYMEEPVREAAQAQAQETARLSRAAFRAGIHLPGAPMRPGG